MPKPITIVISKDQLDTLIEAQQALVENDVYDNDNVILLGKLLEVQQTEEESNKGPF